MKAPRYLRVAVPSPLHRLFDYLPPPGVAADALAPGVRVRVPFARRRLVGLLVETRHETEVASAQLKRAEAILDTAPLIPESLLDLARRAAEYYHAPPGEVYTALLPVLLRQGRAPDIPAPEGLRLTPEGARVDTATLGRAPRQKAVLEALTAEPGGLTRPALAARVAAGWEGAVRTLLARGWIERVRLACPAPRLGGGASPPPLNAAQQAAIAAIVEARGAFRAFLLEGVTGSGKTEVYLEAIAAVLRQGGQALVLVPEIGLTPQLIARFEARLGLPVAAYHSGMSEHARLATWHAARQGEARVVLGTRSAVFVPLATPGLVIVDEEHDPSYKQQEGFRYSARDLAVMRAQREGVPVVLGSATPSFESLHNAAQRRYTRLHLPERAGAARPPRLALLDVRGQPLADGLSPLLLARMREHLANDGQVLLFLNRRGYAPTVLCHDCGWLAQCQRCDARLVWHQARARLICHHCGAEQARPAACPQCGGELRLLGRGTERLEERLRREFADIGLVRIDRDTTRRRGELTRLLAAAHARRARILLGTQMLAKGHDLPDVTLVGIVEADHGLFGADFRAAERLAQLIVQVAGRAGRAARPGEVLIQTHHPQHPLLVKLVTEGYGGFARAALAERQAAELPPYAHLALLRAEATSRAAADAFLGEARAQAEALAVRGVEIMGPVPAPMERRAGVYRAQLLLRAAARARLQALLGAWVPSLAALPAARRARWAVDVDPIELY